MKYTGSIEIDVNTRATEKLAEVYDPPMTLKQIKDTYGEELANKLANDPVHAYRASSGIELIHQEPTLEELDRIMQNWHLMSKRQKALSDAKSLELFGVTNVDNYNKLKGLYKTSALKKDVSLKPHQLHAVAKLIDQDGHALLAHATGTGKTLTSIAGAEALSDMGKANKVLVVVPNGLRQNYVDNLEKFTNSSYSVYGPYNEKNTNNVTDSSRSKYNIVGYETFNRHKDEILKAVQPDTLIVDEAHRTRNSSTTTFDKLLDASKYVDNVITMTGSVVNNEPSDILPLMELTFGKAKDRKYQANHKRMFNAYHIDANDNVMKKMWRSATGDNTRPPRHLIRKPGLKDFLDDRVDYVTHETMSDYLPQKHEVTVHVPMTNHQTELYNYALKQLGNDALVKKIRDNAPVDIRDIGGYYTQLMRARQVSTDPAILDESLQDVPVADRSPKIKKMIDDLKYHLKESPDNKVVVYGNLINSQVGSMAEALRQENIPFSQYLGTGQMSVKERDKQLKAFKKGKNRVILLSAAGGEGLDLPNATMLQMMEGHYNPEKIQQAEARIRRLSNEKQNDRTVEIRRYVSDPQSKSSWLPWGRETETGVDQWIYNIADKKDGLNTEFRSLL